MFEAVTSEFDDDDLTVSEESLGRDPHTDGQTDRQTDRQAGR